MPDIFYTKDGADATFVRSVNGIGPDGAGNVVSAAVNDRRWVAEASETSIDEFNDSTLDSNWSRVDLPGGESRVAWSELGDVLSAKTEGGDGSYEQHAMLRPLASAGGPLVAGDAFITCATLTTVNMSTYIAGGLELTDGATYGSGVQVAAMNWIETDRRHGCSTNTLYGFNGRSSYILTYAAGSSVPVWSRLVMIGTDTWRTDYSIDGVSWLIGGNVSYALTPTHVGLFASSWGTSTKGIMSFECIRRTSGIT